jgi:hypothetical protein
MTLFATGNILLKVRRNRLQRDFVASWPTVLFAFSATVIGIVGNIVMKPENFFFFLYYFIPAVLLVTIMLDGIYCCGSFSLNNGTFGGSIWQSQKWLCLFCG